MLGCGSNDESNQLPQARAGADQSVNEETTVTLNGAASSDSDGRITTWEWSQRSNGAPTVTINGAGSSQATFFAPDVEADTEFEFQLRVQDDSGANAADNVIVLVRHVNKTPVAAAGPYQEVDELSEVTLDGSGSLDADGIIASYFWSQTSPDSARVSIRNQDAAVATFVAPEVAEDTRLEFELRIEDDEGAASSERVEVKVVNVLPRITGLSADFGWHGDSITIQAAGLKSATHGDVEVLLGGDAIMPLALDADSVTFVIPDGAGGYGLRLVSWGELSNGVPFSVRESGLERPSDEDFMIDENGVRVVTSYFIVQLVEGQSSLETAQQIARSVGGEVIGAFDFMDWWQIGVPDQMSIQALSQLASDTEARSEVASAFLDHAGFTSNAIDWSGDLDTGARELNDVEAGAALYEQHVGPMSSRSPPIIPFLMVVGAVEDDGAEVDFRVDDFAAPRDDILALSGEGAESEHSTNVLGVMAAELAADATVRGVNRPGNAGLVRALQSSHNGAVFALESAGTFAQALEGSIWVVERVGPSGVAVLNWSWESRMVSPDGLDCDGATSAPQAENPWFRADSNSAFNDGVVAPLREFFERLLNEYPRIVVVQAAGNQRMNVDYTVPSHVGITENHIIVGAHAVGSDHQSVSRACFSDASNIEVGERASYSNFGERVDIAASGTLPGSKCSLNPAQNETCNSSGTSFAASLVTATVALTQSINPNLSPTEIKSLLRQSANPINANGVTLPDGGTAVFVRPLTATESRANQGKGAMLSVEGAIQAAIDSLGEESLPIGDPVRVVIVGPRQSGDPTQETKIIVEARIPSRDGRVFNTVDLMFMVDVTGSYEDDIETFRRKASEIVMAARGFGADVKIGLASFSTIANWTTTYRCGFLGFYTCTAGGGPDDYPYRLDLALTNDYQRFDEALDGLRIVYSRYDNQLETQLDALFEVAQDKIVRWRPGALRLAFLATDEEFSEKDQWPTFPGKEYAETVEQLKQRDIKVWGIPSGGSLEDVDRISSDTGGAQFPLARDSSEIVEALIQAAERANSDLSVRLIPHGDFYQLVRKLKPLDEMDSIECVLADTKPSECSPKTGVNPGDTVRFEVTFQAGANVSMGPRRLSFRLQVDANEGAVVMEIPVTVEIQ